MNTSRRLVGTLLLVLGAVGFVGCIAAIICAWLACQKASDKVREVASCADAGMKRATDIDDKVRQALQRARTDMKSFNEQAGGLGHKDDEAKRRATGLIRQRVQREVGPNLDELGGRLATFSDAAVVVSSLLQSYQEMRSASASRVSPEQIEAVSKSATKLAAVSRRLQGIVGDADKSIEEKEVHAAITDVDNILERCQSVVDDLNADLTRIRENMSQLEAEVLWWMTAATVAVTVLFGWGALGQVSLFAQGWTWCRIA
jgi:hypothetical protein